MRWKCIFVMTLLLIIALSFSSFFLSLYIHWQPSCGESLFDGLMGAVLGVFITAIVALIAYLQLGSIAKTTSTDFIHKLKNDFFVEPTRILIDHICENRLLYRETSSPEHRMGFFEVKEDAIPSDLPYRLKEKLTARKDYLEVEVDDYLLGHFEDIGLFEEKGLIDTEMAYEEFSYYIIETFENEEIKNYIEDPDFRKTEFESDQEPLLKKKMAQICQSIERDFEMTFQDYSIETLNAILRIPQLDKIIRQKKDNVIFSDRVNFLMQKTHKHRRKIFSKLSGAEQRARKALNRLLLEEAYPSQLPPNDAIRRDEFDYDMYSKFTYIYYKLKDFEDDSLQSINLK